MEPAGFEPAKPKRQIYSLVVLTTHPRLQVMIENKQNCVVQTPKEFIGFEPIEIITKKIYLTDATVSTASIIVEDIGVEPMTYCVQGNCSSQLS